MNNAKHRLAAWDSTEHSAVFACQCGASWIGVGDDRFADARTQYEAHAIGAGEQPRIGIGTSETNAQIIHLSELGYTRSEIAREVGMTQGGITRAVRRLGLDPRRVKPGRPKAA